jgi:hypothetical protein
MSQALCVRCGAPKDAAFSPCEACGLDPAAQDDRELQARSVYLSDPHSSERERAEAQRRLKAGLPFTYDAARLQYISEQLRTQQTPVLLRPAKAGLPPIVWVPVVIAAAVLATVLYAFFSR